MAKKKPPDNGVPDDGAQSRDWATVKAELQELKEKAMADRLQVLNAITKGELVSQKEFSLTIGNIFAVYRRQFLVISDSLADTVAGLLGITETSGTIAIKKILDDASYEIVKEIKKSLEIFVNTRL